MRIAWHYDWTDENGVGHHYPWLFGWHCSVHGRVCDPFTPVTADWLLRQAATDPAVDDDLFAILAQAIEGRPVDFGGGS